MVGKDIPRFDSGRPTTLPEIRLFTPAHTGRTQEGAWACQRRPHAARTCRCVRERWRTRRGPLLLVGDSASTPPIPRWCNGSTPVFGTVRRGSNPRRGATPIPLRNAQSLFRFGVKAIRNFEVNLSPQWTPYGARCSVNGFSPLLFPVAPEQPSRAKERRPPSTVRKGTPSAITPTGLATVCKTVHGWVRLPQSPLIGYG